MIARNKLQALVNDCHSGLGVLVSLTPILPTPNSVTLKISTITVPPTLCFCARLAKEAHPGDVITKGNASALRNTKKK